MFLQQGSKTLRTGLAASKGMSRLAVARAGAVYPSRRFHDTRPRLVVKPVLLADIGEGIVECEVIQWFVEPGARVEEFSPLCEVQSDKASVEITSRFTGTVKKLYYDAGDMAKVGKAFVDIDIQGDAKQEDLEALTPPPEQLERPIPPTPQPEGAVETQTTSISEAIQETTPKPKGKCASLATPAVRHLSKEHKIDIADIDGTGKDGRVLKEDIFKFIKQRDQGPAQSSPSTPASQATTPPRAAAPSGEQSETKIQLTNMQLQMFKAMTRSLTIPHFLYADEVDFTSLVELRSRLNKVISASPDLLLQEGGVTKLSFLPFIIKAVSLALYQYPVLNARVDVDASNPSAKPSLVMRSQHNIGVAMDTPSGLLVPVIKDVGARNILSIAAELARLQKLAQAGKLSAADMAGGTITVSNIGNIGGTYVSPVIVEREVAILGVGRMRAVPAFDDDGAVVKKHITNFSWSADHRVIDGATMARAAEVVRRVVQEPDVMVMHLR
ncbi:2-oxoacid dehydrogenase acyltransferase [Plectosphaerella plurivora]|uniref:Dihydrolipoamide acetyltransferase component of pyruvate dehydrogenase complex n=1 Tax=Plectosphaerella plurivora TaxID=936078 RepID=A0A9P9AF45_9PEZI|nr:2-oxoacid dehydrogenase acyltransferase [Plectosphaerella plurivora]